MFDKLKGFFKDKKKRGGFFSILFTLVLVSGYFIYEQQTKTKEEDQSVTSFARFMETEAVKEMEEVTILDNENKLTYLHKNIEYTVDYPRSYLTENQHILETFAKHEIDVTVEKGAGNTVLLVAEIIRILFFILIFYIVFKMLADTFTTMDVKEVEDEKVTFKDIAGYEYVKEELAEIVDFLKNPEDYARYTDRMPKGVLLEGPPGNGKTLFAKAVAGETDTPFFQISASDIEDKYVGSGARRVEKIFKTVRKRAEESGKVILFIDEIDAVGMKREARTVQETNQTINKLLTEMDGFEKDTRVVIIAATNLSSSLDTALTRSGRFDRIIAIERPNMQEREAVVLLYLKKKEALIHPEVYNEQYAHVIAQQTEGFSNADLDKLVNEASLLAKKKKADTIDIKTLREAFTKIVAGVQTNRYVSEEDKKIVAYHEAGHAMVQIMTSEKGYKGVAYITITPHGQSLGHVSPVSDERQLRKSDLENRIKVALAGRAVEEKILSGDYTVGAASDLQQANQFLLGYVAKYGMSETNQNLYIENLDENKQLVQHETKFVREKLYAQTKEMVEHHFDIVEKVALHLLMHMSLEQHELPILLKGTSYEQLFSLEENETKEGIK